MYCPESRLRVTGGLWRSIELRTHALAAGTHSTWIELRLCEDDPAVCKLPLPGSPWHVPVTVTVLPAAPATDRIVVAPAALDIVTQQGEARTFNLFAHLGTFSKPFQMDLVDSGGLIEKTSMYRRDASTYAAMLTTKAALAPGLHSTTLDVRVCGDDPQVCQLPFPGSPWRIPLTVTVEATPNLSTLAPVAGLAPWTSYNGNAAHTGYVPGTFDPALFNHRWTLQETPNSTVKPPAIGGDKVFVSTGGSRDQAFWVADAASGRLLQKLERPSWSETIYAATVFGDMVYTNGGREDGLVKFNARTGEVEWRNATLEQGFSWAPAADVEYVDAYPDRQLHLFGTVTGKPAFAIDARSGSLDAGLVPMLAGPLALVHGNGMLTAIDLRAGGKRCESAAGGQPAVANGVAYAFVSDYDVLEARAVATGLLEWQYQLPIVRQERRYGQALATSNLVFASSETATVAVDLATRQVVWVYPLGGHLALSEQGVLYIAGANGRVVAINLR